MINISGRHNNLEYQRIVDELIETLREIEEIEEASVYVGFPIYKSLYSDEVTVMDLIMVSNIGVYVFNIINNNPINYEIIQDDIYTKLETNLKKYPFLVSRRHLIFDIKIITLKLDGKQNSLEEPFLVSDMDSLKNLFITIEKEKLDAELMRSILSGVQTAYGTVNKDKREFTVGTKSEEIYKLNALIETYDVGQMDAILVDPVGIQRIRGMAGCGKTVVLARKVAQLHYQNPDWRIVLTYSTRSLKKQLTDMIKRYYRIISDGAEADFTKISVMHAWGSSRSTGLYYEICTSHMQPVRDLNSAKLRFGNARAFDGICGELLRNVAEFSKIYDCILVDEAQDFSSNFFKLCLSVTRNERLVYAYDELQSLGGTTMPKPEDIFGKNIAHDTPLKICYRNQNPVIVTAHAIGMGVYRKYGLIQMPKYPDVWESIGYDSNVEIEYGKEVDLFRTKKSSPSYLNVSDPSEIISFTKVNDNNEQVQELSKLISIDLHEQGLKHEDIMVIDLDTINAGINYNLFDIHAPFETHFAGGKSPDEFMRPKSIVYTSVFRAKGNETFMVYIINAHKCIATLADVSARNAFFTALTRSKGWVKVFGHGEDMDNFIEEFNLIRTNKFKMCFRPYPTEEELEKIQVYSGDIGKEAMKNIDITKEIVQKLIHDEKKDPQIIAKELFGVSDVAELAKLLKLKS